MRILLHEMLEAQGEEPSRAALAEHLRICPSCRRWLEQTLALAGGSRHSIAGEEVVIIWDDDTPGEPSAGVNTPAGVDHSADGRLREIGEKLGELRQEFGRLAGSFEDKIRFDAGREAIIDRLHAELQEYKADLVLKILRPLALEVIGLHDDVGKMIAARQADSPQGGPGDPAAAMLADLRNDIEDVLYRGGFEAFVTDRPEFDPKRQRVVRPVPTADPGLDRVVAERLRKGFAYQGHVIRPEMVNVYVASAPAAG